MCELTIFFDLNQLVSGTESSTRFFSRKSKTCQGTVTQLRARQLRSNDGDWIKQTIKVATVPSSQNRSEKHGLGVGRQPIWKNHTAGSVASESSPLSEASIVFGTCDVVGNTLGAFSSLVWIGEWNCLARGPKNGPMRGAHFWTW